VDSLERHQWDRQAAIEAHAITNLAIWLERESPEGLNESPPSAPNILLTSQLE
jgi:hypothetical protein